MGSGLSQLIQFVVESGPPNALTGKAGTSPNTSHLRPNGGENRLGARLRLSRERRRGAKNTLFTYETKVVYTNEVYIVFIHELPGCVAGGKTRLEAVQHAKTAIRQHVDELEAAGLPIPAPNLYNSNL